jgi:hypothetical protein
MRTKHAAWGGVLLVLLLALVGCGGEQMVTGTVNVDGKPLPEGSITFTPVDGKTSTAGGFIKNGGYSVKVPVGVMRVSINAPKVVGKKKLYNTPDSPLRDVTAEALPAKYNEKSELKLDVKSGNTQKDFELQSK